MVGVDSWKNSVHTEDARRSSARHSRTEVYLHRVQHETGGCEDDAEMKVGDRPCMTLSAM